MFPKAYRAFPAAGVSIFAHEISAVHIVFHGEIACVGGLESKAIVMLSGEYGVAKACVLCGAKPFFGVVIFSVEFFRKRPIFARGEYSVAFCAADGVIHHTPRNVEVAVNGGNDEVNEKTELHGIEKPTGNRMSRSFKVLVPAAVFPIIACCSKTVLFSLIISSDFYFYPFPNFTM